MRLRPLCRSGAETVNMTVVSSILTRRNDYIKVRMYVRHAKNLQYCF